MIADLGEAGIEDLIGRAVAGEVVADNALVKLLRLQQITSGHVKTDDGRTVEVGTAKADALVDLLSDIPVGEPVVVFCVFRHDLAQLRRVAERLGRNYGEISGSQKDLTDEATMPKGIELLGVQWQSGAVGIDLTRARYGVIFSPTFNGGDYEQGLARQHRPGQTRPTVFYHLVANGTVDNAIYGALKKRKELVGQILSVAADAKGHEFNRRYGKAIRILRHQYGLLPRQIHGLDPAELGEVESGERRASSSIVSLLATAHNMGPNQYMDEVAQRLS
jgi:SNF2 family DNA or RNA helicase